MRVNPEEIKLTPFEEEIERKIEAGDYELVENFEEWKFKLQEMAEATLENLKGRKLLLEFESPEVKEKALKLLKKQFGEKVKVVNAHFLK